MDNTMSSIEEYPLCLWKDSRTLSISFASHPKVFDFLFTNALAGQLGIRLYENPNQASKLPTKQIRRRENENGLTTTLPSLLSGKVNLRSSFTGNYYFRLSYLTLDRVTEDAKYEKILGSQTHMAKDGQLRTAAKTRPAGAYDTERANHVKRQERWR